TADITGRCVGSSAIPLAPQVGRSRRSATSREAAGESVPFPLAESLLQRVERGRSGAERLERQRVQRRLHRLVDAVQIRLLRADIEQARDDLAGLLASADILEGRAAIARIVILADLAQPHAAAVVKLDFGDLAFRV